MCRHLRKKDCAELPLPSYTIAVHSVPTNVDSVVNGNNQAHVVKQIKVMQDGGAW